MRKRDAERRAAMSTPKANDLAIMAEFLERERTRYESFKSVQDAIVRIGSLNKAESDARQALEDAQADLAWARAEIDAAEASVAAAKDAALRQIDDIRRDAEAAAMSIAAQTGEKRAALEKLIARLETTRAAADLIVGTLAGPATIL
jgi:BMFP domain-containing protein YqiC